jgi:hypothetical protein
MILGASVLLKLGEKIYKVRMKKFNWTQREGTTGWFSHLDLVLTTISPPVLDLPHNKPANILN